MATGRIPKSPKKYDDYIGNVAIHLNAVEQGGTIKRGITLGMLVDEIDTLNDFRTAWSTGTMSNPGCYDLHRNPDTKGKGSRAKVVKHINDFSAFFRPILTRMSGSPAITTDDRLVLGIAEPKTQHKRPTVPISDAIVVSIESLGNGTFRICVRPRVDSARFSLANGANGVEVAYAICEGKFKAGAEIAGKVKVAFLGPDDGAINIVRTTARFNLNLDSIFIGFELRFYIRWINVHYPDLASAWSGPHMANIS